MKHSRCIATVCVLGFVVAGCGELIDDEIPGPTVRALAMDAGLSDRGEADDAAVPTPAIQAVAAEGCVVRASDEHDGGIAELQFTALDAKVDAVRSRATVRCQIAWTVAVPAGFSVAVEELSVEGMLALAGGTMAKLEAQIRAPGRPPLFARGQYFRGPLAGPLAFYADFAEQDRTFVGCAGPGTIYTDLTLHIERGDTAVESTIALTRFRPLRVVVRPCGPVP